MRITSLLILTSSRNSTSLLKMTLVERRRLPLPLLKRALVVMDALALSLEARIVFALPHIVLIEMAAIFNGNPTTLMRAMDVSAAFAVTSVGRI